MGGLHRHGIGMDRERVSERDFFHLSHPVVRYPRTQRAHVHHVLTKDKKKEREDKKNRKVKKSPQKN